MAHAQAQYPRRGPNNRDGKLMSQVIHPTTSANLSITALSLRPAQWDARMLGAICFSASGTDGRKQQQVEAPCIHVPMPTLETGAPVYEIWHSNRRPTQGQCGDLLYRCDDDILFGTITLPEHAPAHADGKSPLQHTTESAYRQIFSLLDTLRFPHLFRVWNYMADINIHSFGLERYFQFNLGRQDAFVAHQRDVTGNVPAACALGSSRGPLTIAFLAGRTAPLNIENPRQTSAYRYPRQYGPSSPTFSRASLARLGQEKVLFISGTASIVGHTSLHPADVVAQTRETMANIKAVLAEANRVAAGPGFDLTGLYYKVYLRNPAQLPQVRAELARCAGDGLKAIYLQADVCRQDLLLEIEATSAHLAAFMPDGKE